jgi:hypothetical protein
MHVYCYVCVCIKYNDPSDSMITIYLCGNPLVLQSHRSNSVYWSKSRSKQSFHTTATYNINRKNTVQHTKRNSYSTPNYNGYFFPWHCSPNLGLGLPPWNSLFHFSFLDLRQLLGLLGLVISSSQGLSTQKNAHTETLNIHALSRIQTHDPGFRASEDSACLRPLGNRDWLYNSYTTYNLLIFLNYRIKAIILATGMATWRNLKRTPHRWLK